MPRPPAAPYNSRTAEKFVLRLEEGLNDIIATTARQQSRSKNSQINYLIKRGLEADKPTIPVIAGNPALWKGKPVIIESFELSGGDIRVRVKHVGSSFSIGLSELTPIAL